jgi:Protein of unknown function (DUF2889)
VNLIGAGLANPTTGTLGRHPLSVRRTSHINMMFGDGPTGDSLRLTGRARDLYTDTDGDATVVAEAEVDASLDEGRHLRSLTTRPLQLGTADLHGLVVGPGFRSALQRTLAYDSGTRPPLYLLLDDLPVAALISGYASLYNTGHDDSDHPAGVFGDARAGMVKADICSGWRGDGTMMVALRAGRRMPAPVGPPAPSLLDADDPLAWHDIDDLAANSMRRRRLVDVTWGDPLTVHAMFRDTHTGPDGTETVLHEYTVEAAVDAGSLTVLRCEATPRSLPWMECPEAAGSASRLEGRPLPDLRDFVRRELTGTTTCTHLNDLLRSLADVAALATILGERGAAS